MARRHAFVNMRNICFALAMAMASPALADAQNDCDRLAASPSDPQKQAEGVKTENLDAVAAEAACRDAVARAPQAARFKFQLGRALDKQDKLAEARAMYLAALAGGSAIAASAYGKLLELGLGGAVDYAGAADYYQRAIDGGYKYAAGDLGYLHEHGYGFPADPAKAAELYTISVDAGDSWSMVQLGLLYENARGVPRDFAKAMSLYRSAAEKGDVWGQYDLGVLYEWGRGAAPDPVEAMRWYRRAAEQDNAQALRAMATFYSTGTGIAEDDAEAERLLRKAIALGGDQSPLAQNQLAFLFAGNNQNLDEAATLVASAMASIAADSADRPSALDTAAWVAYRQHKFDDALRFEQEALTGLSSHAPLHDRLGDIYAALGRKDEARTEWQKAMDLPDPGPAEGEYDWSRTAVQTKLQSTKL